MLKPRVATSVVALVLAAALAVAGPAGAVLLTAGTGSGLAGQNVDIPISVDNTTGLSVLSCQFDITYNAAVVTPIAVLQTGTLSATAGWQPAAFAVVASGGRVRVSDAGNTALTGAGTLMYLRFAINPALINGSGTGLSPSNVLFNEGTPVATTANGFLTVNVTPQIFVSPTSGEIIRGQTLQFTVSGTPTLPLGWSTSNAGVATINAAGLLTGVGPGSVTVTATDAAAHTNTTSGVVLVRGMGLTMGSGSVLIGHSIAVPITVTDVTGLGIRAGQVTIQYNNALLTATGVTTPAGTLLNGYGSVGFGNGVSNCTVDFAGVNDLAGSGILCYLTFQASATSSGGVSLFVNQALFNEVMPAKTTNGFLTVSPLPTITVSPDVVTLLAGQTQQYTVSGSPTPPITWSVVDPTLATISSGGLLTAVKGGITQVRAQDNVGAIDYTTSLVVNDFRIAPDTVTTLPGSVCDLRLRADRLLGGLGIYSLQYKLQWTSPWITNVVAKTQGLIADWTSSNILSTYTSGGSEAVVAAGPTAFTSSGRDVEWLEFTIDPAAPASVDIPIVLNRLLCNEGWPVPQLANGLIRVRNTIDVPSPTRGAALALAAPTPNPARLGTLVRFSLPEAAADGEAVRLAVVGIDGRLVRTLVDGPLAAGDHSVAWEGHDESGVPAAPGLYFVRLQWHGQSLARKLAVVR